MEGPTATAVGPCRSLLEDDPVKYNALMHLRREAHCCVCGGPTRAAVKPYGIGGLLAPICPACCLIIAKVNDEPTHYVIHGTGSDLDSTWTFIHQGLLRDRVIIVDRLDTMTAVRVQPTGTYEINDSGDVAEVYRPAEESHEPY